MLQITEVFHYFQAPRAAIYTSVLVPGVRNRHEGKGGLLHFKKANQSFPLRRLDAFSEVKVQFL